MVLKPVYSFHALSIHSLHHHESVGNVKKKTAEAAEKGLVYIPKGPRVYYTTPSTTLKASVDVLNRSKYFKRHVVSGELTYQWQPNERNSYSFSPLTLTYEYMHNVTDRYLD